MTITFETFAADILGDWQDAAPIDGALATYSSPLAAAKRVVYEACVVGHKAGAVLLVGSTAALARQCRELVEDMFGHKMLKPLVRGKAPDGIALRNGLTVEFVPAERRRPGQKVAALIVLDDWSPATAAEVPDDVLIRKLGLILVSAFPGGLSVEGADPNMSEEARDLTIRMMQVFPDALWSDMVAAEARHRVERNELHVKMQEGRAHELRRQGLSPETGKPVEWPKPAKLTPEQELAAEKIRNQEACERERRRLDGVIFGTDRGGNPYQHMRPYSHSLPTRAGMHAKHGPRSWVRSY
jgi:hypothetical protein